MTPGIYDMPDAEYFALPALNHSTLKHFERGALYVRHYLDFKDTKTKAKDFGNAVHLLALQGEEVFFQHCAVVPVHINRQTKIGKEEYEEFCKTNEGKILLSVVDEAKAVAMATMLQKHPFYHDFVVEADAREKVLVWQDPDTGMFCKCKLDLFNTQLSAIVDYKTIAEIGERQMRYALIDFNYWTAAGFYLWGARECGLDLEYFVLFFQGKDSPYEPAAKRVDPELAKMGELQCRCWLKQYNDCSGAGQWPSVYEQDVADLRLPELEMDRLRHRIKAQCIQFGIERDE